jgi:hypothetical protein
VKWTKNDNQNRASISGRTYIGFVLDESGSMQPIATATIVGFNEWLDTQQRNPVDDAVFSLTLFNTEFNTPIQNEAIKHVLPLDEYKYQPGGGTALFDAIASVATDIESEMQSTDRALIVILTDGHENSSRKYKKPEQIKAFITEHEARGNWTFTYLSASPTAWEDAASIGTQPGNVAVFAATEQGMTVGMRSASDATLLYRGASGQSVSGFYADDEESPKEAAAKKHKP